MKKKFNLSQIFKSAWTLVKSVGVKISEALKTAWAQAKNGTVAISIEELATRLGAKVWAKGDMKRIYMNNVGYNTNKMKTTAYIYQVENEFKVSCFIDCPTQHSNWIAKERQSVIEYLLNKIEQAL